jgi:glycerol transport system permease protein
MNKTWNNKAWFMVLPMLALVAFSAVIPLMTVVNYSVQDTFGNNVFFWAGTEWFEEILHSDRFWAAMGRNLVFSAIILAIEVPLGIFIALNMPRKGWGVPVCLVLMALPLLIPFNVVGTIWQVFGRIDIGLLGRTLSELGVNYNYVNNPVHAWITIILMSGTGRALSCFSAMPGSSPSPTPITRRPRSTARPAGPCSATSSCRRCTACCSSPSCCASWTPS